MNVFLTFSISLVAFTSAVACMAMAEAPKNATQNTQIYKGVALTAEANNTEGQSFGIQHKGRTVWSMRVPGFLDYAYTPQDNGFIIRQPNTDSIYTINLAQRTRKAPIAKVEKVGVGQDILGYPTTQWQVRSLGQYCGDVFTSTQAAENIGLNYTDQTRIQQGIAEALSKKPITSQPCESFVVPSALGGLMGYALAITGPLGEGRVTSIDASATLPKGFLTPADIAHAKDYTEAARKEVLISAFPAHEQDQIRSLLQKKTAAESVLILKKFREIKELKKDAQ